jgi:predicted thioesterase
MVVQGPKITITQKTRSVASARREGSMSLREGMTFELERKVTEAELSDRHGNPWVHVFTTPKVVEWMEEVATNGVQPHLPEGQGTAGTVVNMKHLAATPVGLTVKVVAHLKQIDGRRLVFWIEAFDDVEKIAECHHERFVVDLARFHEKVAKKRGGSGPR